jgi:hypothetical protein
MGVVFALFARFYYWIARGIILANLVGDERLCVGPIMLILASAIIILRHSHGSFKAGKFTIKESKIMNFNNGCLHVVMYIHHNLRVPSVDHFCHVCTISLIDPKEGEAMYNGHPRNDMLGRKILNSPQPNQCLEGSLNGTGNSRNKVKIIITKTY